MAGVERDKTSLTIIVGLTPDLTGVVLTTWGIRQGRYGSLGRVTIPRGSWRSPTLETDSDLAAVVLTALYGLDYAL